MASTRQKALNRLSSIFLPSSNSVNSSTEDTSNAPDVPSLAPSFTKSKPKSKSKPAAPKKNKVRKSTASLPALMDSAVAWPLPASDESLAPACAYDDAPPQLSASPHEELARLDFGWAGSDERRAVSNPSANANASASANSHDATSFAGGPAAGRRVRPPPHSATAPAPPPPPPPHSHPPNPSSSSSSAPAPPAHSDPLLSLNPNGKNVIFKSYGNHSFLDLSKSKRQASMLMKRQKSESILRRATASPSLSSGNRVVSANSSNNGSSPSNPALLHPQTSMSIRKPPPTPTKRSKTWLFGGTSGPTKREVRELSPPAWITGASNGERVPYDLQNLTGGKRVPELWNDAGTVVVHLFPRSSRFGPQFRLSAELIASSSYLASLAHGSSRSSRSSRQSSVSQGNGPVSFDARSQRVVAHVPGGSSYGNSPNASHTDSSDDSRERDARVADTDNRDIHLYLPLNLANPTTPSLSEADVGRLVLVRNLFAFLSGQSLLATRAYPTTFAVFVQVANLLQEYGFSNMDQSTFGEVANASFNCYAEELALLDVRQSPTMAVEGLILGERMRSSLLWNEAFTHTVGRYSDIQSMSLPLLTSLSPVAKTRVERAHMNLEKRLLRIQNQFSDFDFPSVFGGIINSRTAKEREIAGFEQWKSGFQSTRRFFLNHLKAKHRSWPPKRPRGAGPSVPALSRSALQGLYLDATVLYDLMVDRKHPSSRLMIFGRNFPPHIDRRIEALRKVLQEYDQSGSPTYPVMPFDAPRVPRIASGDDDATAEVPDRVAKSELAGILKAAYNKDAHDAKHPFASQWMSFEYRTTAGMTIDKVANFRLGAWLFLYCVLQALPMVTVDAPGVNFKDGVQYFLCEPSRGRLHWSKEGQQWELYRDPVTGVVTKLAKDTVDLSDEAMYRLSHCWQVGAKWEQELTNLPGKLPTGTSRKVSTPQPGSQLPTPPSSERRFSGTSSHGHQSVHPAPQHLSLQSLYMAGQDQYSSTSSPQAASPHHGSPQLLATDPRSGSPVQLPPQSPYHLPQPQQLPYQQPPYQQSPYQQAPQLQQLPYQHSQMQVPQYQLPLMQQQQQYMQPSPYNTSPEMLAAQDPVGLGFEHPPIMPGIQEEIPTSLPQSQSSSRNHSPASVYGGLGRRGNRESIFMSGLERLPVPAATSPMTREQRSARTASMTFDEILGPAPGALSVPHSPKLNSDRNKSRTRRSSRQLTR